MGVQIIGDENRPRFICHHCKNECIVDIRPFNKDMSKLAQFTCNVCGKITYGGLILLTHPKLEALLGSIKSVIDLFGPGNTTELGKKGN